MTAVGSVRLRIGAVDGEGIVGWRLRGAATADLDGLPTTAVDSEAAEAAGRHPNGALLVDHLVVVSPQLQRTVDALETAGIALRRMREPEEPGPPVRQAFFRLGEVILEVAQSPGMDKGPARFWGVTFRVQDIDACAGMLGERLGEVRDAVQPGRRIATVRRQAELGLPVALITA